MGEPPLLISNARMPPLNFRPDPTLRDAYPTPSSVSPSTTSTTLKHSRPSRPSSLTLRTLCLDALLHQQPRILSFRTEEGLDGTVSTLLQDVIWVKEVPSSRIQYNVSTLLSCPGVHFGVAATGASVQCPSTSRTDSNFSPSVTDSLSPFFSDTPTGIDIS